MLTQNIEIEVPEGFEAKYNPETQKIEMIKKYDKPRTWEEFCKNYRIKDGYWIDPCSDIRNCRDYIERNANYDKNLCTSKSEAEAFLALMQLRQLRKAWIGDWEVNWEDPLDGKHIIYFWNEKIEVATNCFDRRTLSFPTKKMAEEFLDCFRGLIEKAKILL